MKAISLLLVFACVSLAARGEDARVSLRYEKMELEALAREVLSIEDFGTRGYVHDLELLRAKFTIGMTYDELYRQLLVLKSKNLYCSELHALKGSPEIGFTIFHFPERDDGLVKESIRIAFRFSTPDRLDGVAYSTSIFSY